MSEIKDKNRRDFIRDIFVAVPAAALLGCPSSVALASQKQEIISINTASQTDSYTPLYFKSEEWKFILSACDCLIPHDEHGPGALETNVPVFIDRQMFGYFGHAATWYMEGPFDPSAEPDRGYQLPLTPQQVYRLGIDETNKHCQATYGKIFADLDKTQQVEVLQRLDDKKITSDRLPLNTFFSFLLQNTKEGYFADPIHGGNQGMQSWKMIGYPGARASYLEWVEKYNTHYPLGPVSIQGKTS